MSQISRRKTADADFQVYSGGDIRLQQSLSTPCPVDSSADLIVAGSSSSARKESEYRRFKSEGRRAAAANKRRARFVGSTTHSSGSGAGSGGSGGGVSGGGGGSGGSGVGGSGLPTTAAEIDVVIDDLSPIADHRASPPHRLNIFQVRTRSAVVARVVRDEARCRFRNQLMDRSPNTLKRSK